MTPTLKKYVLLFLKDWYDRDEYHHIEWTFEESFETLEKLNEYVIKSVPKSIDYRICKNIGMKIEISEIEK